MKASYRLSVPVPSNTASASGVDGAGRTVGGSKKCLRCKEKREFSKFHRDSRYPDGLRPACKDCVNERNKELNHNYPVECHRAIQAFLSPGVQV